MPGRLGARHTLPIEVDGGAEVRRIAEHLLRWITPQVSRIFWGKGQNFSSFIPTIQKGKVSYQIFRVNTDGRFVFRFDWLNKKPPFDDETVLRELLSKINAIPGIPTRFGEEVMSNRARIPMKDISSEESIQGLKAVITFIIHSVKSDRNMVTG